MENPKIKLGKKSNTVNHHKTYSSSSIHAKLILPAAHQEGNSHQSGIGKDHFPNTRTTGNEKRLSFVQSVFPLLGNDGRGDPLRILTYPIPTVCVNRNRHLIAAFKPRHGLIHRIVRSSWPCWTDVNRHRRHKSRPVHITIIFPKNEWRKRSETFLAPGESVYLFILCRCLLTFGLLTVFDLERLNIANREGPGPENQGRRKVFICSWHLRLLRLPSPGSTRSVKTSPGKEEGDSGPI